MLLPLADSARERHRMDGTHTAALVAIASSSVYPITAVHREATMTANSRQPLTFTAQLIARVEQIVRESGDPDGFDAGRWVAAFLDAPSPALGGRRPADFIETSEGRTVVSALIGQMQSGAYA